MIRSLGLPGALLVLFIWGGASVARAQPAGPTPPSPALGTGDPLAPSSQDDTRLQRLFGGPSAPDVMRAGAVGPYGVSAQSPAPLVAPGVLPGDGPGWFAVVDVGVVRPHANNRVTSGSPVSPLAAGPVELPVAPLSWTVSPRFELGYRLHDGRGDLRVGYRFLDSSGFEAGSGAEYLRSRLDLNVVDFDYVSGERLVENWFEPFRDLRASFGVRLATSYLDSQAHGGAAAEERFTSHFVGAGPRFGLEWARQMTGCPVELYTRFDAAGLVGSVRQGFSQAGSVRRDAGLTTGLEVVGAEVGLGWRLDPTGRGRVVVGYQFQQWWDLGRTDTANFDLTVQGAFVRAEWRF